MWRITLILVLLGAGVAPLMGQTDETVDLSPTESVQTLAPIANEFRKLGDWKPHAENITRFIDEAFQQNGWTNEEDKFVLDLTKRLAQVPPWDIEKRLNMFTDTVGRRYEFDQNQKAQFKGRVMREAVGMFAKNAGVITKHTREFIRNRAEGEPFTAEQVARMTDESDELMADAIFRMDRLASTMRQTMTDRQKALLDRDYQALDRRLNDMLKQRAAWSEGKWKPEDWGMKNDPIQQKRPSKPPPNPIRVPDATTPPPADVEPAYRAEDESTWEKWVREFIEKHKLDPGQVTAIESILVEMQTRAANFRVKHKDELPDLAVTRQAGSPAYEPFRTLFEELKSRSYALLRNTQRSSDTETAEPADPSSQP